MNKVKLADFLEWKISTELGYSDYTSYPEEWSEVVRKVLEDNGLNLDLLFDSEINKVYQLESDNE